ncbi:HypC/HybG/HupF family hydrogenase formation chaperone [Scytonema sp. PRP1]|uniref:HypC/HybG/HupF family hydrogenase formation chaperone n=1 Tax=Scytonema sp. PRP1 TaxID=3120513 RepID=UPI002FD6A1A6
MCLAVPGKILSISGDALLMRTGKVSFGGVIKEVSLAYIPEAKIEDYVIVHVGFAISILDPQEAERTLDAWRLLNSEYLQAAQGKKESPASAPYCNHWSRVSSTLYKLHAACQLLRSCLMHGRGIVPQETM